MKTIHVSTGSPYDIMIERGILDNCGEIIKKLSNAEKITIVTDKNVAPLYKWRVLNSLSQQGYQTTAHVFQAAECNDKVFSCHLKICKCVIDICDCNR